MRESTLNYGGIERTWNIGKRLSDKFFGWTLV